MNMPNNSFILTSSDILGSLEILTSTAFPVNSEQWIKLECKSGVWLHSKHRVGKETETTRSNNNETLAGLWSTFTDFVHNNTHKMSYKQNPCRMLAIGTA